MSDFKGDHVEKAYAYRHIESLEEYVVIDKNPDSPRAWVYLRSADWEVANAAVDGQLRIASLDFTTPLLIFTGWSEPAAQVGCACEQTRRDKSQCCKSRGADSTRARDARDAIGYSSSAGCCATGDGPGSSLSWLLLVLEQRRPDHISRRRQTCGGAPAGLRRQDGVVGRKQAATVPLSPFQKGVLGVLVSNRLEFNHFAGGLVLNAPEESPRFSGDLPFSMMPALSPRTETRDDVNIVELCRIFPLEAIV